MTAQARVLNWILPFSPLSATEADWEALYRQELPRIYNFFRYRVGNSAVAEDLTSLTFEKAWGARHRYRRDLAAFSTWLFTIARNVATDHFRRSHHEVPLEEISRHAGTHDPEAEVLRRAENERLAILLAELPERERDLLSLKYGAGLTNRAIAQVTGLSESNIGTILHRTIGKLREQWTEERRIED